MYFSSIHFNLKHCLWSNSLVVLIQIVLYYTLHLQEKIGLAMWILENSLSLQEINAHLQGIRSAGERHREQLLDASGVINDATVDINHYVRTSIGQAQGVEEGHEKDFVDVHHQVKLLEIQIAERGRMSRDSFVNDSSSETDFEDIEAYAGSLGGCYDGLQSDDNTSVTSARTI
jgi:hypothetical protein